MTAASRWPRGPSGSKFWAPEAANRGDLQRSVAGASVQVSRGVLSVTCSPSHLDWPGFDRAALAAYLEKEYRVASRQPEPVWPWLARPSEPRPETLKQPKFHGGLRLQARKAESHDTPSLAA